MCIRKYVETLETRRGARVTRVTDEGFYAPSSRKYVSLAIIIFGWPAVVACRFLLVAGWLWAGCGLVVEVTGRDHEVKLQGDGRTAESRGVPSYSCGRQSRTASPPALHLNQMPDLSPTIQGDVRQYGIGRNKYPKALTLLAYDDKIILASSQIGPSFSYAFMDSPVLISLELCEQVWRDNGPGVPDVNDGKQRREGKCAEIMELHLYYTLNDWGTAPLSRRNARIATVTRGPTGEIQPTNPRMEDDQVRETNLCTDSKGQ